MDSVPKGWRGEKVSESCDISGHEVKCKHNIAIAVKLFSAAEVARHTAVTSMCPEIVGRLQLSLAHEIKVDKVFIHGQLWTQPTELRQCSV